MTKVNDDGEMNADEKRADLAGPEELGDSYDMFNASLPQPESDGKVTEL